MAKSKRKDFGTSTAQLNYKGLWDNMSALDKAALMTSPIPVAGDIIGGIADAKALYDDPSWTNAGLAAAGLLPFVPPMVAARSVKQGMKDQLNKAVHHAPNYIPGFYGGNPAQQAAGVAFASGQGAKNMLEAAYSPKAQGLWKEQGVSLTDQKVAQEMMAKMEGTYKPNLGDKLEARISGQSIYDNPDKKLMGQINQSRQFNTQYNSPSKFYDQLDGMDQKAWADLDAKSYQEVMGKATGMKQDTLDTVFRAIKQLQGVSDDVPYRMAVRRPNTQSSGNLQAIFKSSGGNVFGGQNINAVKRAFTGGPKKSNKELVNSLEEQGIKVYNKEKALKGDPIIVQGAKKTDAYELGGANFVTVIKKDGTMTSFMNDEHDLFSLKAPMADRLVAVSTPMHYDLLNKGRKSKAVETSMDLERAEQQAARESVEKVMTTLFGADPTKKMPNAVINKAQYRTGEALANLKPTQKDSGAVAQNVMAAILRGGKPIARTEDEE